MKPWLKTFRNSYTQLLLLVCAGCGTVTGNPGSGGNTNVTLIVWPQLSYQLPEELTGSTGLSLTTTSSLVAAEEPKSPHLMKKRPPPPYRSAKDCTSVLECLAKRATIEIHGVEQIARRMEDDSVNTLGSFTGKGPDGQISGWIKQIGNDSMYKYEGVVCHFEKPVVYMRWNEEGTKVRAIRSHKSAPLDVVKKSSLMTEIVYSKTDQYEQIEIFTHGPNYGAKDIERDGNHLTEVFWSKKFTDGQYLMKSTSDWQTNSDPNNLAADKYLSGQINSDKSGYFVEFRKDAPECSNGFNENDPNLFSPQPNQPGWCIGRELQKREPTTYEKLQEIAGSLTEVGIITSDQLKVVNFPTNAVCEQN